MGGVPSSPEVGSHDFGSEGSLCISWSLATRGKKKAALTTIAKASFSSTFGCRFSKESPFWEGFQGKPTWKTTFFRVFGEGPQRRHSNMDRDRTMSVVWFGYNPLNGDKNNHKLCGLSHYGVFTTTLTYRIHRLFQVAPFKPSPRSKSWSSALPRFENMWPLRPRCCLRFCKPWSLQGPPCKKWTTFGGFSRKHLCFTQKVKLNSESAPQVKDPDHLVLPSNR